MKRSSVSIIIPIYNVEKYLNRCLDSVISQTFKDIEIICINDGSTDSSLNILLEYSKIDSRIIIIDKKNTGVSECRNIAINHATGEYIAFIDSDDWVDENMIELMYRKAKKHGLDLVMCTYMREFENHSKEKKFEMDEAIIYSKEKIVELHRKLIGPINNELVNPEGLDSLGTVWAKLYRADIIKKNNIKFEDLNLIGSNEDGLFNIYIFNKIERAMFINRPLYHYWRENKKSITSKYNPNLINQWKNLFSEISEYIKLNNLSKTYEEALNNRIAMSVLGLGLNECSSENKQPVLKKVQNIRTILIDEDISRAYKNFKIESFPLHWRSFYFFNKRKMAHLSYYTLSAIEFLRKRLK